MAGALLIIDYSNDFVDDKGALSCGAAGQALDDTIAALIGETARRGDYVVVCDDWHDPDDPYDPERGLFPAHNLAGSWGAQIYGHSGELFRELQQRSPQQTLFIPKLRYSAFFGTPLDAALRARGVRQLTVCGVCTDICVLHTVIDACYLGYQLEVVEGATATIIEGGQQWAIAHMRDCLGVSIR